MDQQGEEKVIKPIEENDEETEEELVLYRALYGEKGLWVRPLVMFTATVLIDGKEVPRFAYQVG